MKIASKYLLFLSIAIAFAGCQDVIEVELPEGAENIVINGRVTDLENGHVEIMATAPYFANQPNPRISGARVFLFEDGEEVEEVFESEDRLGWYIITHRGTIGKVYQIRVVLPEDSPVLPNTVWTCKPETLRRTAPLDSVYQKFISDDLFLEDGYYAHTAFTEPQGRGDRYRVRIWRNDTIFSRPVDIVIFDDEFIDGLSFNENSPFGGIQIDNNRIDTVTTYRVEQSSISRGYFEYLTLLRQQLVQVGTPFDPPPAPIIGNIHRDGSEDEYGYGYFAASALSIAENTLQP